MPHTAKIRASFDHILAELNDDVPLVGFRELDTETAFAELDAALSGTILPRRITISSEDGARLSVIARNRRVIKVADVHPQNLWEGAQSPQATVCEGDYESFSSSFSSALLKVVADNKVMIEQTFLSHGLGTITHKGYPASMLCEKVPVEQSKEDDATIVQGFFDAFPDQPRARFGANDETQIPANSQVDPTWLAARVTELREELDGQDTNLRFLILEGEDRRAAAIVWIGGEGCMVMSEYPENFDELEFRLGALREHL